MLVSPLARALHTSSYLEVWMSILTVCGVMLSSRDAICRFEMMCAQVSTSLQAVVDSQ